jgi:hypothetical protein
MIRQGLFALALALGFGHSAMAAPPSDLLPALEQAATAHPKALYPLASDLAAKGRKQDAAFVFFVAQLRWRAHLASRSDAEAAADSIAFEEVTKPLTEKINPPLFRDYALFDDVLTDVIAYDLSNPDRFTDPAQFADVWKKQRGELMQFHEYIKQERQRFEIERKMITSP